MPKPTAGEYSIAFQNPHIAFEESFLRNAVPEKKFGTPWVVPGNFAAVCRMSGSGGTWAIRCFLRDVDNIQQRYSEISEFLERNREANSVLVGFRYSPKGILVGGAWHPIIIMDWVDGDRLDHAITSAIENDQSLEGMLHKWIGLDRELVALRIAHGDLQHGNIMNGKSGMKLVDYDGMCVPSLAGKTANEFGHPNYRNPKRNYPNLNLDSDRFSSLLIYTGLYALSIAPELWRKHGMPDDAVLFREEDLLDPNGSRVFEDILRLEDRRASELTKILMRDLETPGSLASLDSILASIDKPSTSAWIPSQNTHEGAKQTVVLEQAGGSSWWGRLKSLIGSQEADPMEKSPPGWMSSLPGEDGPSEHPAAQDAVDAGPGGRQGDLVPNGLPTWISPHLVVGDEVVPVQENLPINPVRWLQSSLVGSIAVDPVEPTAVSKFPANLEVVGNRTSYKYHLTACRYVTNRTSPNWIGFSSAVVAESRGYGACRHCLDAVSRLGDQASLVGQRETSASSPKVGEGSYVGLRYGNGREVEVKLIRNKTSRHGGTIDIKSPQGVALLGASLGDKVRLPGHNATEMVVITSIRLGY